MKITRSTWKKYISVLRKLNGKAAEEMIRRQQALQSAVMAGEISQSDAASSLVDYAYAVATKYGEGAAAAACEMYDAVATLSNAKVPPAVPAQTATFSETAKAVYGTLKNNPDIVPAAVGRLVKTAGADTTIKNAIRDGAEWAWIPSGDSCSFCLMLASQGWVRASDKVLEGGHAEHIHNNCDCTFAIRFDGKSTVDGYDPDALRAEWDAAEDGTWQDKIRALDRKNYAANREAIQARKRAEYAARMQKKQLDGNGGSNYNNSPAKKTGDERGIPVALAFSNNGMPNFIPKEAVIVEAKPITGFGTRKVLRDAQRLAAVYKKADLKKWTKMVGKIYSDRFKFDIHWYEYEGIMYEHKIKHFKERE